MKKWGSLLFLILILGVIPNYSTVEAQESAGSISFTPSAIPEIGFEYNPQEYQFELTWKGYYLNIKPFAVFRGDYYTLEQIIPWMKSNYPGIDYRTAADKFKNYHRWGFWLEKLPQHIADDLDYLGFDVSDTNIPLSTVEVEEIQGDNFTFKRLHIGGRFSIDFYDLYERGFEVTLNKTTILIGNVKGKTDLDMDPITYADPTITVIGTNGGAPWTFWDIWNASNVNSWGVVHNNQLNNTQYQFDCKLVFGDSITTTTFYDYRKQIFFRNVSTVASDKFWEFKDKVTATFGQIVSPTLKITKNGIQFIFLQTGASATRLYAHVGSDVRFYSCSFENAGGERIDIEAYITRVWNSITDCLFEGNVNTDFHNVINQAQFSGPSGCSFDETSMITSSIPLYLYEGINISNVYVRTTSPNLTTASSWTITDGYLINIDTNTWGIVWSGVNTKRLYRQNTFNLDIIDENGDPVYDAEVFLTWSGQGGGTAYTGTSPVNGSIPEQTITKGFYNETGGDTIYPYEPYNLTITKTGYETMNLIFNVSEPITWMIALVEESIDVEVTIGSELLVFSAIAGGFMLLAWFGDETKGLVAATLSFFVWFATGLWWLWEKAPAGTMDFFYIFEMLALVSLMLAIYKAGTIYKANSKTGMDSF